MTPEQKAARLEAWADREACWAESYAETAPSVSARHASDAALLRESAGLWRERDGVQWHIKDGDIIQTAALYQGRFLVATGKEGHTACWTASKKHDERSCEIFDTAESLPAAQAAAIAWVDAAESTTCAMSPKSSSGTSGEPV